MFFSSLVTHKIDNLWELQERLIWDDGTVRVDVPAEFKTDLASIPRWLWWIWKPWGRWARAATLHDWLYENSQGLTRWQVDWLFYRAMRSDNVDSTALIFWAACVLWGWQWFCPPDQKKVVLRRWGYRLAGRSRESASDFNS